MDELVKRLKNCATQAAPCKTCDMTEDGSCSDTLMKQAADAIEELSKRSECPCWYGGIRFCAMLGKPIPEPQKEENEQAKT